MDDIPLRSRGLNFTLQRRDLAGPRSLAAATSSLLSCLKKPHVDRLPEEHNDAS